MAETQVRWVSAKKRIDYNWVLRVAQVLTTGPPCHQYLTAPISWLCFLGSVRQALFRWWQRWPLAVPGLITTANGQQHFPESSSKFLSLAPIFQLGALFSPRPVGCRITLLRPGSHGHTVRRLNASCPPLPQPHELRLGQRWFCLETLSCQKSLSRFAYTLGDAKEYDSLDCKIKGSK